MCLRGNPTPGVYRDYQTHTVTRINIIAPVPKFKIMNKRNEFRLFADIDPNDKSTILGAYLHNGATIGAIVLPILTIFWAVFILKFAPILVGFLPCSIIAGVMFGGLVGSISYRIKYGFKD